MAQIIEGMDDLERSLARILRNLPIATAAALYREGEQIMGDSHEEAPVDQGVLKNNGFVFPPNITGDTVEVTLGYGGEAAEYAVKQHEDMTLSHTHGKAKFLEDPATRRQAGLAQRIADEVGPKL